MCPIIISIICSHAGNIYWRYNSITGSSPESGYPQPMLRWGMPYGADAAFAYNNNKVYFFKDSNYYRYNDTSYEVSNVFLTVRSALCVHLTLKGL